MFDVDEVSDFIKFLKDYNINFFIEPNRSDLVFTKETEGSYPVVKIVSMLKKTFNSRSMSRNIEKLKSRFGIKEVE